MSTIKSLFKALIFPFVAILFGVICALAFLYDIFWKIPYDLCFKELFKGILEITSDIILGILKGIYYFPRSFVRWNDGWDRSKYDAKTLAFWALQKYGTDIQSAKWMLKEDEFAEYKELIKRYPQGYSQYKKEVEEAQKKEEEEKRRRKEEKSIIYSMDAREYELYIDSLKNPYNEEEDDKYLDSQYKNSIENTHS